VNERYRAQLPHTLVRSDLGIGTRVEGKVRDIYRVGERLALVTTDRVSAFDVILGTVPFKGEILTRLALFGFERTKDIVPNHVVSSPHPNVIVARRCTPFPVEFVVRGYITGSLWRDYLADRHHPYGVPLPAALRKDQALPAPILTPSTKAEPGAHDAPTSREAILAAGIMTETQWNDAARVAFALYERGRQVAADHGLILVDTKYELGLDEDGRLTLIDEVHTPDSSRYWMAQGYETLFAAGKPQRMLDKENLREWLRTEHNYTGHGTPPSLSEDIRIQLATRYADALHLLTGAIFEPRVGAVQDTLTAALPLIEAALLPGGPT
jgi:phosphoribosylaminoimidazole-succinocarboxamide synthase